ncbi:MAG: gfo/Idh/MocA family oxidoreductase, partial [Fibrobacter sp.]|nr:gfo/Idh/MocA family oxidoreductase [Fibrobacter sp.]
EHKYSARCRDVNVALDLLVHDLSLCLSMFRYEDLKVEKFTVSKNEDRAQMQISIVKGAHAGAELDFVVDRNSDIDVRTISVEFVNDDGSSSCDYSVSLAPHNENGEVVHISDSLENEHKFFLKLMAGACSEWGRRAAQCAANAVKLATITTASS